MSRFDDGIVPVDVQNPDEGVLLHAGDQSFVDMLHNPVEQLSIDMFRESIAGIGGLQTWEGLNVRLCCSLQLPVAQPVRHVLVGDAHKVAKRHQVDIVGLQTEKEILNPQLRRIPKASISNTFIARCVCVCVCVCDGAGVENIDH